MSEKPIDSLHQLLDLEASQLDSLLKQAAQSASLPPLSGSTPTQTAYPDYLKTAAVLSTFSATDLNIDDSSKEYDALIDDSTPVIVDDELRFVLSPKSRRQIIGSLASRSEIQKTLSTVNHLPDDPAQRVFCDVVDKNVDLGSLSKEDLTNLHLVSQWFPVGFAGVPSTTEVRRQTRWLQLMKPFEDLAGERFFGRQDELATLASYVGVLDGGFIESTVRTIRRIFSIRSEPPLMMFGPGGMGKSSLIGRFILNHVDQIRSGNLPFVYIDFDRARIVPDRPVTLIYEVMRQLEIQFGALEDQFDGLRESWSYFETSQRGAKFSRRSASGVDSAERVRVLDDFVKALNVVDLSERPFLLVLDTFEKVRFSTTAHEVEFWKTLDSFQESHPFLRLIISGRVPVGLDTDSEDDSSWAAREFMLRTEKLEIKGLDTGSAREFLEHVGFPSATAASVAEEMNAEEEGISPLSLRVAARIWERGDGNVDDNFWAELKAGEVQEQLIRRYLNPLGSERLRRLANPGFVLRRLDVDLIENVLNEPCELNITNREDAQELFNELTRAIDLVTVVGGDQGELLPRNEVRQITIRLMHQHRTEIVNEVNTAAADYYRQLSDSAQGEARSRARAEEIYHMLAGKELNESRIRERWHQDVDTRAMDSYLGDVEPELSDQANVLLLELRGERVPTDLQQAASLSSWEAEVERQFAAFESPADALALLQQRDERSPGSRLYELEARSFMALDLLEDALAVAKRGLGSFDVTSKTSHRIDLLLLTADILNQLNDRVQSLSALEVARGLAEERHDHVRQMKTLVSQRQAGVEEWSDSDFEEPASKFTKKECRRELTLLVDALTLTDDPPTALLAAVLRGDFLEELSNSDLRQLGRDMATYDIRVSEENGEEPGAVAKLAGVRQSAGIHQSWQDFFVNLPTLVPAALNVVFNRYDLSGAIELLSTFRRVTDAMARSRGVDQAPRGLDTRLSGRNRIKLEEVLLERFDAEEVRMLLGEQNLSLESIVDHNAEARDSARRVVERAADEGWLGTLINRARAYKADDPDLFRIANEAGIGTARFDHRELDDQFKDARSAESCWSRLARASTRICRVESQSDEKQAATATGMLVGPDLVLTTVAAAPETDLIECVFDASHVQVGIRYQARVEFRSELGYALLRATGIPGEDPLSGIELDTRYVRRGWLDIYPSSPDPSRWALAIQYPPEQPLIITTNKRSSLKVAESQFQIRARLSKGAAGGAVFTNELELIGMVLSHGPKSEVVGLTTAAIAEDLARAGISSSVGQELE